MPNIHMSEDMVKDFVKLRDFMTHSDKAFDLMLGQLEAVRKIVVCQRAVMKSLYENLVSPFVSGVEGVSKIMESDSPLGGGDGAEDDNVVLTFVGSETNAPDAVTESTAEDGLRCVSIPDTVAHLIGEKQREIEAIINRFDTNAKDTDNQVDFDLHMASATIEIQHLLNISYKEARILFRLFMAQFLGLT